MEGRKTGLRGAMGVGRALRKSAAALTLLSALACVLPLRAFCAGETDYIVKYRAPSDAPFAVVSEREMKRLRRADALEWYEPDGEAVLLGSVSPYYDDVQWNLDMIGADAAFRQGFTGQGVRVGVLDSGVNAHPDLEARLLPGRNYIPDVRDPDDTSDAYGHGTRIAGLIAAANESGFIGAAPGAEIVPVKITDGKSVKVSALCAGIYGAIDDFGCTVLNLSMGVQTDYAALREAVNYAEEKGVTVISAAGNNGNAALFYPAAYDSVIGVGAIDGNGYIYYHSNHNAGVYLAAPGVDVRSTASSGGYMKSSGTSFAVPHVSAAAAVLKSIDPALTPARIREILAETASDSGDEGYDEYFGYGVLNLAGCVAAVTDGAAPPAGPDDYDTGGGTTTPEKKDETKETYDNPFTDVTEGSYYYDAVKWAVQSGVTTGTDEAHFSPDAPCTRAQTVTFLWRAAGCPEPALKENPFGDTDESAYYYKAVLWAYENGITLGTGGGAFSPDGTVIRGQTVTFLYRALKGAASGGAIPYADVSEADFFAEAVQWAAENGITLGTGDGAFSPEADCIRAQIVTFLYRAYAEKN